MAFDRCRLVALPGNLVASATATQARIRLGLTHRLSGTRFPKPARQAGGLHARPGLGSGSARSDRPTTPQARAPRSAFPVTALRSPIPGRQEAPIGSGPVPRGLSRWSGTVVDGCTRRLRCRRLFPTPRPTAGWKVIALSPP